MASRGLCQSHGGGKQCSSAGCPAPARKHGKCIRHGGKTFCSMQGCRSAIHYRGQCCRHGGHRLCNVDGCTRKTFSRNLQCSEHHFQNPAPEKLLPQQPIQRMKSILRRIESLFKPKCYNFSFKTITIYISRTF